MQHTTKEIENENLFNLSNKKISDNLVIFMKNKVYPWELLGKNLFSFLQQIIEDIPKEARIRGEVQEGAIIKGDDVVICEGAVVEPTAYIEGPTWIGPNATVRHGAYVRGKVFADADTVIGHATEVKGSILMTGAKAAHFNYVGDSVLGVDTNLGAGTKLANLKLKKNEVGILVGREVVRTGLKKMGAILGDNAQTGCNVVTNPGTLLLPNTGLLSNTLGQGIHKNEMAKLN